MNVFDLWAKLSLDSKDYDEGLDKEKEKTESFGSKLGSVLGGVGTAVGTATIAAVSAATAAVTGIVSQAINSYSEYEQLVGGSKLVFGEAYDFIMDKSVEAYKNVQLSQSEYLRQVNGFAVGLKEAMGGNAKAAAELADRIVNAEADVVAAMGISQEAAQSAFNGIMKGNFTMVDNLMLGIKPTQEGFQEMIDKVNEWNATQGRATSYTMDNIADMQAALVDYIEMQGLSGYASQEASETIQGSMSMVKAAWSDLMISMAGGGKGMEDAISALVESVEGMVTRMLPTIEEALYGFGDLIQGIVPIIAARLPELLAQIVPMLLETAINLVNTLIEQLPTLVETIVNAILQIIPQLLEAFINVIDTLLISVIPLLLQAAIQIVIALGQSLANNASMLIRDATTLITTLIMMLLQHLPEIIEVGLQIILALVQGISDNLPYIIDCAFKLVDQLYTTIVDMAPKLLEAGFKIILALAEGIVLAIPRLMGRLLIALGLVEGATYDTSTKVRNQMNGMTNNVNSASGDVKNSLRSLETEVDSSTYGMNKKAMESSQNILEMNRNVSKQLDITGGQLYNTAEDIKVKLHKTFDTIILDAQIMVERVSESFRNMVSSISSAADDIVIACDRIASAIDSVNSMSVSANFGGAHASGGWMSAGTTYLVGELGPELVTPSRSGYVHTAAETASLLGRSSDVYITIQGDVYDDERSMKQKFRGAVINVLQEQLSYG